MGATVGSIIATIIVVHIVMNTTALMSKGMAEPTDPRPCAMSPMPAALRTVVAQAMPASTSRITTVVIVARRSSARYAARGVSMRLPAMSACVADDRPRIVAGAVDEPRVAAMLEALADDVDARCGGHPLVLANVSDDDARRGGHGHQRADP
jgi:hypothetical protein